MSTKTLSNIFNSKPIWSPRKKVASGQTGILLYDYIYPG